MATLQSSTPSSRTIKVIGAGFGRTGTTSLKQALNILGFKCYHMQEILRKNDDHLPLWVQAFEGKLTDYDLIFKYSKKELETDPYTATVDWPSTAVYEKLMEQYPDAKVILTLRDAESWYKRYGLCVCVLQSNHTDCTPEALIKVFWRDQKA